MAGSSARGVPPRAPCLPRPETKTATHQGRVGGLSRRRGSSVPPLEYYEADLLKRRNAPRTPIPVAARAAVAIPRMLLVTHARQALQHAAAIGACSPYLAAA